MKPSFLTTGDKAVIFSRRKIGVLSFVSAFGMASAGGGVCLAQTSGSEEGPNPCDYPFIADYVSGDCDLDGDVDNDDFTIWQYYNTNQPGPGEPITPRQGDVNRDGLIDTSDMIEIITQYLLGASLDPIPEIHGVDIDTTLNPDGSITLYDNVAGVTLCSSEPLYSTHNSAWYPPSGCDVPCVPSDSDGDGYLDPVPEADATYTLLNETKDGFDIKISITNSSSITKPIGHMRLTGLTFGSMPANAATYYNPQFGGKQKVFTDDDPDHARQYPGRIYAPVHVLEVDGYTLGLSVQYPILEYEHTMTFGTRYENNAWTILLIPNKYYSYANTGLSDYNPAANIGAGETREYIVSVRILTSSVCNGPNECGDFGEGGCGTRGEDD